MMISREDIKNVALQLQNITKKNAWFGVFQYVKNDRNWNFLGMYQKVQTNEIMSFCNTSGASRNTILKIKEIIKTIELNDDRAKLSMANCTNGIENESVYNKHFNETKFIQIANNMKTNMENFSSCDAFVIYEKQFGMRILNKDRKIIIDNLIKKGIFKYSGFKGNDLKLLQLKTCRLCTFDNQQQAKICQICGNSML